MAKNAVLPDRHTPFYQTDEFGRLVDDAQIAHNDIFCVSFAYAKNLSFGPQLPAVAVCEICKGFKSVHVTEIPSAEVVTAESWLSNYNGTFEFLLSVKAQYLRTGRISEGQRSGVEKCMARDIPKPTVTVASEPSTIVPKVSETTKPSFVTERIPTCTYAVESRSTGKLAFFQIDSLISGKWSGWTFVKQVIGGHEDERVFTIRPDGSTNGKPWVPQMLEDIKADMAKAIATYSQEFQHCAMCHRSLTDEVSRERGLGPDCAAKLGF